MANDSRKFKQNQMMFCIQPCIVEFSIPIGVGEDRLRGRGSLPAKFYRVMEAKVQRRSRARVALDKTLITIVLYLGIGYCKRLLYKVRISVYIHIGVDKFSS